MTERPPAPPEGELIKKALEKAEISQREAARRAGISEARWRQIVSGYQSVGGSKATFRSPDKTLARMATVVGVTPEQLEEAGRPGAADALRAIEAAKRGAEAEAAAAEASGAGGRGSADGEGRLDERWHLVEAVLHQARVGLTPAENSTLADRVSTLFGQPPAASSPAEERPARKQRKSR